MSGCGGSCLACGHVIHSGKRNRGRLIWSIWLGQELVGHLGSTLNNLLIYAMRVA